MDDATQAKESRALDLVRLTYEQFGIGYDGPPRPLPPEVKDFRVTAQREEIDEYADADPDDLVKQYDALLDLLVFTLGTLYLHGFPFLRGLEAVVAANRRKEVGPNHKRGGYALDLRKPPGWQGPETRLLLILDEASRVDHQ